MTACLNKAAVLGFLGRDPESRSFQNGGSVVNLAVATTEYWRDQSGARQKATEWHSVAIFNEALGKVAMDYLRKGSAVYVEGQLRTREFTDSKGIKRRATEIVLPRHRGELKLMDPRQDDAARQGNDGRSRAAGETGEPPPLDDEVPF